jgi:hypothetical protein
MPIITQDGCTSTSAYSITTGLPCATTAPATPTDNSALITELTAKIASLKAQIQALPAQQTAPAAPTCVPYMTKYIQLGADNDTSEVNKLQNFLIVYEGDINLSVTGIYDQATYNAVLKFQTKYATEILAPWGDSAPTGYVYSATEKEINELYCSVQTTNK